MTEETKDQFYLQEGTTAFNVKKTITSLMHKHPFYAYLLGTMQWVEVKSEDARIKTLATDGKRIFYNPSFFNPLTVQQRVFAIAHELMHCMTYTLGRKYDRDMQYWNMASDYVINATLIKDEVGEFIKGCLYDKQYDGMSADQIYEILKKNGADKQETLDVHMDSLSGIGDPEESSGDKDGSGKSYQISQAEMEKNLKEFKDNILEAYQFSKAAGNTPNSVHSVIENLTTPKINWKTLLTTTIRSLFKNDLTWKRPSRRSVDPRFILPSMWFEDTVDICVSIDTSGSISEEQKRDFLSEIQGILKYFKNFNLQVWCFDTQVHAYKKYKTDNLNKIKDYQFGGGGGTDIACNFEFMKEKKIKPKIFVCLTDGENCSESWGPKNYCNSIWIIHSNNRLKTVPFGKFVKYENFKK